MRKKPYKYFMSDGTPMIEKCKQEKIGYFSVLKYIGRGMTPDEAMERAKITKVDPYRFTAQIYYKGEPFIRYCRRNNIPYCRMMNRIRDKMMTIDEALNWKREKN